MINIDILSELVGVRVGVFVGDMDVVYGVDGECVGLYVDSGVVGEFVAFVNYTNCLNQICNK